MKFVSKFSATMFANQLLLAWQKSLSAQGLENFAPYLEIFKNKKGIYGRNAFENTVL